MLRGLYGASLLCATAGCVPAQGVLWELAETTGSIGASGSSSSLGSTSAGSSSSGSSSSGSSSTSSSSNDSSTADPAGSTGTGTSAPCPIQEGFGGGGPSAAWGPFGDGNLVDLVYGETMTFEILEGADGNYNGLIAGPFTFDGGFAQMRVLQSPEAGTPVQLFLSVRDPDDMSTTRFLLMIDEDFRPRLVAGDQTNQLVREPFDAAATPWVRTRFEQDDVVFELSADGLAWDERARAPLPAALGPMHVSISAGSFQPLGSPSTVEIDDVVVCPGG